MRTFRDFLTGQRRRARQGFTIIKVRAVGSAEEFLASGVQNSLRCLITDVQLPGISGFGLRQGAQPVGKV
jgi:FixJ family two-component response regulator